MIDTIPIFSSHYSLSDSILTLEPKETSIPENPTSIFDLVKDGDLKELFLVDTRMDGFVEAQKNADKQGVQLNYGIKFVCCEDHEEKNEDSLATESNIIIFARNTDGISDLIRIYNRAWTENFYYQGRTSWRQIKEFWTENLLLVLPFFSSYLAKNTLTTRTIIPSFPVKEKEVLVFNEINSHLPFESLIKDAIEKSFSKDQIINTKSVYYKNYSDFLAYQIYKCIHNKTKWDMPNINHLASNTFSWEDYKNSIK